MDTFGTLNAFTHSADTRSFTAAGGRLGLSASAVGKAVTRLEERMGVRLLHRSTRNITLTHEGELFLEHCRRILEEFKTAEAALSKSQAVPSGLLRVSLPLAGMILMPTLSRFMDAYPEVELDLDFTDRLVDVIEEGFDVVIRTGDAVDSRLMTRLLGTFGHQVVASPDYLQAHGTPQKLDDLHQHACMHHKYPSTGKLVPWRLRQDGIEFDAQAPRSIVASTLEPLIELVLKGKGLAYLPDYAVRQHLLDGRLVALFEGCAYHKGHFRAIWPQSRLPSPKRQAFVSFLAGNMADASLNG